MYTLKPSVLVAHAGVGQNPVDIITLLETYEVEWPFMLNESASTLPHTPANAKEVPPKEIVGQRSDVHCRPSITLRAAIQIPAWRWSVRATPTPMTMHILAWVPAMQP